MIEGDISGDGGVMKRILKEGNARHGRPPPGSFVDVHYEANVKTAGTRIDSSRDRGVVYTFQLGSEKVLKAWSLCVATMLRGERAELTLKPSYAYGDKEAADGLIPANSTIIFDIELLGWDLREDVSEVKNRSLMKRLVSAARSGEWIKAAPEVQVEVDYIASYVPAIAKKGDEGGDEDGKRNDDDDDDEGGGGGADEDERRALQYGESTTTPLEQRLPLRFVYGQGEVFDALEQCISTMTNTESAIFDLSPVLFKACARAMTTTTTTTTTTTANTTDGTIDTAFDIKLTAPPPNARLLRIELKNLKLKNPTGAYEMDGRERLVAAEERKATGNRLMQRRRYALAEAKYKKALSFVAQSSAFEDDDELAVESIRLTVSCHLNLAACHSRLEQWRAAIEDANHVLALENNRNVKALYRRALALMELLDWEAAERDLRAALRLDPTNADVQRQLQRLRKMQAEDAKKQSSAFGNMFSKLEEMEDKERKRLRAKKASTTTTTTAAMKK